MLRLISFSLNTSSAAATRSSVSAWSVTPFSPAQAMVALVPRKSNRWESSFPAWFSALSTSWRSTLLTTSKDESAMAVPLPLRELPGLRDHRPRFLYAAPVRPHGGLPEWPMGADCKSVGLAYEGSNPSPATPRYDGPRPLPVGGPSPSRAAHRVGARALATAVRSSGWPPRNSQPKAMSTYRVHRTVTSAPSVSADQASSRVPPSASWSATAACAVTRVSGRSVPTPSV